MSGLTIQVNQLTETPQRFELQGGSAWWNEARDQLQEPQVPLKRAWIAPVDAYRIGARLIVRGRLSGVAELQCGRCMSNYAFLVDEALELLLEPAGSADSIPEEGIELDPEDLGIGRYAGDELHFGPVFLEILALAWPMQPRCSEGCQGLCPRCGFDRNQGSCDCDQASTSRPFAALGKLLDRARKR